MRIALAILIAATLGDASVTSLELRRSKLDGSDGTLFERVEHGIEYAKRQYADITGDGTGALSERADSTSFE